MKKSAISVRLLSCILAILMLAGAMVLTACNDEPDVHDGEKTDPPAESTGAPETDPIETDPIETDPPETEPPVELTEQTVALNKNTTGIKILGVRNLASETKINADWSASGIEFVATCEGDMTFAVESSAGCYFRAYVDGEPWNNGTIPYYTISGKGNIVLKNIPRGTHTIRVIKVTGYTLATAAFTSVKLTGIISEEAPADKDLYIEFIGDSITCAWGTIGNFSGKYTDQDATLAYSYLLAEALDADYSMTALSGQGICHGPMPVPNHYRYACKLKDSETEYDFSRKADLLVVNIGTNDQTHGIDTVKFREEFKKWIEYAKEMNGEDCKFLAIWNMKNTNYYKHIKTVFDELGGEAAGYYIYRAKQSSNSVASKHPSKEEHAAYVPELKELCEKILATPITNTP